MAGPSGATPRLALPFPTETDNVDVPRDIKALADKLDAVSLPARTATLPSNPTDGQEVYLALDANKLAQCRYNSSAARWEILGCTPLWNVGVNATWVSPTSWAPVNMTPSLMLPFRGAWVVKASGVRSLSTATPTIVNTAVAWPAQATGRVGEDPNMGVGALNSQYDVSPFAFEVAVADIVGTFNLVHATAAAAAQVAYYHYVLQAYPVFLNAV